METYREHIGVKSASSKSIFESAYKAFIGIEELIDTRQNMEQVYDYLQANINGLKVKSMSPVTIKTYFSVIKQYLHYRGIKLDPMDIRQSLNFPKKQVEELRPLELGTFRKILKACSAKREMLYLAQSSSGMRIGEMVQLRKKDIHTDMARLMVKIPAAFTKTGVARTTFFSAEAAQLVSPRLKKIGDSDLVFSIHNDPKGNVSLESKYLDDIQKKMGISDKYETNGRNVITTHSFRAFFITKVSRKDPNLAKYFSGQKGYLLQYDRLTDAEKLAHYMGFESRCCWCQTRQGTRKGYANWSKRTQGCANLRIRTRILRKRTRILRKRTRILREGTRGWQKRYASWKAPLTARPWGRDPICNQKPNLFRSTLTKTCFKISKFYVIVPKI